MSRPLCLVVLSAVLNAAPLGAATKITGPTQVAPYRLVRLAAEDVADKAGLLWRVYPSAGVDRAAAPRGRLEFVAPPGTYEVELLAITVGAEGAIQVDEARTTVIIGTPPPPGRPYLADPVAATVRLRFGNSGCTATVLAPRRLDGRWDLLTASHCTGAVGSRGTATLKDGRVLAVTVAARDTGPDLSWLVTDDAGLANLPFAWLASADPAAGTRVWHQGYGVDQPGNRENGTVTGGPDKEGYLRFDLSVSAGDSGSGIFRGDTGELVATVCCTTSLGRQTTMWGGAASVATRLRPPPAERIHPVEPLDDWLPVPMPVWHWTGRQWVPAGRTPSHGGELKRLPLP